MLLLTGKYQVMKFKQGESGNPSGRPKGATDKRTELNKLLRPHAENLVAKAVELALAGDVIALRICLDRLIPRIKNETINFLMPELDLTKSQSLLVIGSEVLKAVANGNITPEHACNISAVLEAQRKTIETCELADRIGEVEYTLKQRKKKEKQNA